MSRIFLSHSSKDDFAAVAIHGWLNENGWHDIFLDLDAVQGIHPGERWERALHEHATRCEAVLFLVSHQWLASEWCRREYELAHKLNKRVFIVLIDDLTVERLPVYLSRTQAVSLAAGEDHEVLRATHPQTHEERHVSFSRSGLARLKAGLTLAGLDPRFFAWPPPSEPNRAPYRGLEPLESVDAGIFFGRDAPVIEALDTLRGLREGAAPRIFVILGASGAGKSSFLRAGLLPRLERDDLAFLPLHPIRPERAAITGANGLVAALAAACAARKLTVTRAQLRDAAVQGAAALRPYLRQLASRAEAAATASTTPTLVLIVDQAEELFRTEGAQESESLLALLRDLVAMDDPAIIALVAIRSDSYDALEHAEPLEGLRQQAFPLLPMPRGAYQTVIEGPAQRLAQAGRKFTIDPALTQALLADLEKGGGSDALPLLAFTLQQLFADHAAAGSLTRENYESFGGLKGAIDAATARVFAEADKDGRIPRDGEARLALLRRGLIPWLAGIDPETKTPRRRRAPESQIPEEARPLVDLLVEQRLLTRTVDGATHTTTLEPAHEALLRQWGNLKGWLEEDFGRLVTLEGVKRAARDWDANGRNMAWAAHSGARLQDAVGLDSRPDLAAMLNAIDRAYLAACSEKDSLAQARERALAAAEHRSTQRTRIGFAVSSILAILAIAAAIYGFKQAQVARHQTVIAQQQTLNSEQRSAVLAASVSQSYANEGALDQAILLMLDAGHVFNDKSVPDEIRIALTKALEKRERIETRTLFPDMKVFDTGDALLLVNPATEDIWQLTDSIDPKRLVPGAPVDSNIIDLQPGTDGKHYIVVRQNHEVERINASSGARQMIGMLPDPKPQPGRTYELNETKIIDGALVVRSFFVTSRTSTTDKPVSYYQFLDTETGTLLEGDLIGIDAILNKAPGGGVYALDGGNNVLEISSGSAGLAVRKANLSPDETIRARYGDCVATMPAAAKAAVVAELGNQPTGFGAYFTCRKVGTDYLIEEVNTGSAGKSRDDVLLRANGKKIDVRDTLTAALAGAVSNNNSAWVGAYPTNAAQTARLKMQWLGVLVNRNAYVLNHEINGDEAPNGDKEYWSAQLNYRHPAFVQAARFVGSDRLIVAEAESGRLVAHDFGKTPKQNYFATPLDSIVGTDQPVATLHHGTCVGFAIPRTTTVAMPDGRRIVLNTSDPSHYSEKHELEISGPNSMTVTLGDDTSCVEFSADWKRLLAVRNKGVTIYDFDRILSTGTLAGNEIGFAGESGAASAFFLGASDQKLIAANDTNHVTIWSPAAQGKNWVGTDIYEGDNTIGYAEPDASGGLVIILENVGGGGVHGFLYSLRAREQWFDLGSDYKWLGAAFTDKSDIVVAEHWKWARVLPLLPLSAMTALGDKKLSAECRPPAPTDYRRSPCWPASYR